MIELNAEQECAAVRASEHDEYGNAYEYEVDGLGHATLVSCTAAVPDVSVPAQLGGAPVTRIGDGSFASAAAPLDARKPSKLGSQAIASFAAGRFSGRNGSLRRVSLPEGVVAIGRGAFRGCSRLCEVGLPSTLEEIADYAFSCTDMRSIDIPQGCVRLAPQALTTGPEALPGIRSLYRSKLERIGVHPENPAYCMCGGVLCRRIGGNVGLEAVLCPGCADEVNLSCGIGRVLPTAFAGTGHVGTFIVGDDTRFEGDEGLLPSGRCDELLVRYKDSRGAARSLALRLPADARIARTLLDTTRAAANIDALQVAAAYDEALLGVADPLEQSTLMLARLASPAFLAPESEGDFRRVLHARFETLCMHYGARGQWERFDLMADAGLLDAQSAERAVDVLSEAGDASAVRYVLKLKRERFERSGWDYEL